nr:MAG TPA: hypothetical protein [Caudoviricetes sp.]
MKKPNFKRIVINAKNSVTKRSPEILIGIGITGMISATVMAVKATPKALILIEEEKDRQNAELCDEAISKEYDACAQIQSLSVEDTVKTVWKCYVPAVLTAGMSIACIVGANSVHRKRHAALTAAYTLSETSLREYQKKVIETIGEKKEEVVRDAVAKERIEKNPIEETNEVFVTSKGDVLCLDIVSGRYFKSDIDRLKKIENELNRRMRDEMYIALNDLYYEIGLPGIKVGDDLGWNIDTGYIEFQFSSQLATDGTPCLVIDYAYGPRYDFRTLM